MMIINAVHFDDMYTVRRIYLYVPRTEVLTVRGSFYVFVGCLKFDNLDLIYYRSFASFLKFAASSIDHSIRAICLALPHSKKYGGRGWSENSPPPLAT